MLFLPQRPYMILGTLRHQLLYPTVDRDVSDEELHDVLCKVNLPDTVERCGGFDMDLDFGKMLSIGEQQRLAVARVLLTKPRYTVLDEATSALDGENEAKLYLLLAELDTTLVSVTHHSGLLKYHRQVLELTGQGGWKLHDASRFQFDAELSRESTPGGAGPQVPPNAAVPPTPPLAPKVPPRPPNDVSPPKPTVPPAPPVPPASDVLPPAPPEAPVPTEPPVATVPPVAAEPPTPPVPPVPVVPPVEGKPVSTGPGGGAPVPPVDG